MDDGMDGWKKLHGKQPRHPLLYVTRDNGLPIPQNMVHPLMPHSKGIAKIHKDPLRVLSVIGRAPYYLLHVNKSCKSFLGKGQAFQRRPN
jgi:hypothetical protein